MIEMMKKYSLPKPVGDRILVELILDELNGKPLKSDFLYIPDEFKERAEHTTNIGKVIDIGKDAFIRIQASEPYCCPDDYIMFLGNAGSLFKSKENGKTYRVIKPADVMCVIGTEE
jgi:co-chaperonin GroES (HSP10)